MRSGSKGSIYRRLALIVLAIAVVGLIAVPFALAAEPTMVVGGLVHGKCYSGTRTMAAVVAVPDPSSTAQPPDTLSTTQSTADGFFLMIVPLPGSPATYADLTITSTALSPALADWSAFFSTGTSSFENIPGGAEGVSLSMVVKNTTVSGVVKSAKTKKAVKGVKVTVGNKTTTTNAKGAYKIVIGLWPATKYAATFAWKGHKKATTPFTSSPNKTVTINKSLK